MRATFGESCTATAVSKSRSNLVAFIGRWLRFVALADAVAIKHIASSVTVGFFAISYIPESIEYRAAEGLMRRNCIPTRTDDSNREPVCL